MNIIEKTFKTNGKMDIRSTTERIILHHADASHCTVEDIDRWHKNRGYCKIGYHFFVDKQGNIYRGREENTVGAHAYGSNYNSIGICAEGRYMEEIMPEAQKNAIIELVNYLKQKYNITKIQRHKDVCATSCPGTNFPFSEIVNAKSSSANNAQVQTYTYTQFVKDIQVAEGQTGKWIDGIAGTKTLNFTPTVSARKNRTHPVVKPIQKYLYALGYTEVGQADGIIGKNTTYAICHFQKDNACVQDGEITARCKTWKKLLKLA